MKKIQILWFFVLCHFLTMSQAAIPIETWTMSNGAKVFLISSPALPMVDIQIDFDGGSRRDPETQQGLAQATASMISKGVRAKGNQPALDENGIGEAWADLGASFSASATSDRMSFVLRSLTSPDLLDGAIALAARLLAQPTMPADIWKTERDRWIASIKEANTKPAQVASRAYEKQVFGNHPYGYEADAQNLNRLQASDLLNFHRVHIQACRAHVSLVGALNKAQAQARVAQLLSLLPASNVCAPLPTLPEVQTLKASNEQLIAFESAQAHVLIGQPGIKRNSPDFFALTVGNYVLGGGGFVSRLTEQVREKRGLSYSVYSYFSPARHAGSFTIGLQTRPDQAKQAIEIAKSVLQDFVRDGPTPAELQAAKDNLIGGFALRIDSNKKLLDNIASISWNGLPLDYLETWTQQIEKLTVEQVKDAFSRTLQPDRMVTVVVGGKF